jgi:integrase
MTKTKFTGVYFRDTKNGERVYYITYKINNKTKKEKIGTSKEGVTAVYASKMRSKRTSVDRLKDDAPMLQNKKMQTLDECFNEYFKKIEGKSDAENIKCRYNLHVKKIFGHLRLDEITTDLLQDFKQKSRKQISIRTGRIYAPKTINDWLNIVGTVFNFMINKHGLKIINPAHGSKLEREKVDNDRERYLEIEEIKKLWEILDSRVGSHYKEYVTENMKIFLALSLSTGARIGSVLTITKADVNLTANSIMIKNHKSDRTYSGYLHPNYRELIECRIKKLSPMDYLVNGLKKEMDRSSVNKVFHDIFEKNFNIGLDAGDAKRRVVIHTLRHTFASQLAIQGTPIYTIMRLMDHADISQTIRYAKLNTDSARDNVFQLKI